MARPYPMAPEAESPCDCWRRLSSPPRRSELPLLTSIGV